MVTNNKLIGANGGIFYDSTATLTGNFYMIEVQEDTVIATLTETGAVDATASGQWNISGKTLKQGAVLTPKLEDFTSIALTSGSVILRNS